ncbi:hypothetical protein GCM10011501_09380 [Thalassotalea profundi]|uniref:EAL domain-containing protein n=2 Tax=Thalassotalea profundi TaxID=2036687 RepID=A0ABQ3IGQ7_9GAMM|nr:hypothetical protein GCM10011501_09380 [Thalassotalea profundi]
MVLFLIGYGIYSHNQKIIAPLLQSSITDIRKETSFLIDENSKYSVDWVTKNIHFFKAAPDNQVPFTLSNDSYWVLVTLTNTSNVNRSVTLFTDNFILTSFNVFKVDENLTESLAPIYQLNNDNILLSFYPNVAISLEAKQQAKYLFQLKSDAAPKIPVLLVETKAFERLTTLTIVLSTVFVAVVVLMTLYNLIIYFAVQDKVYLFYIGYLISALIVLASINGFGRYIFPFEIHQWFNEYTLIFHYSLVIFLILFTVYFLQYNGQQSWLFKLSITICGLTTAIALCSLFFDHVLQAKIFFSLQPLFYLLCIVLVVKRVKTDFAWARYYILSWIPLLIGAAIQPLSLMNIITNNFYTRNAFLFAVIIELILMAFALAERMRRNEKERLQTIRYHNASGLPRKSNLETTVTELIRNGNNDISVVVIKPEHIERIALYIDDKTNTELFKNLSNKLSSLYAYNDAVIAITDNHEKLCFINNHCLAFILNNELSHQPIEHLVKSTQDVISDNFRINDLQIPLSGVIGITHYPKHGKYPHELINNALLSLNIAEKSSKKWAYFHDDSLRKESDTMKMAVELKQALEQNKLALYHQPQIDLKTLRVCSSECLIRWSNTQGEFIPPTVFIPLAEDIGLINSITLWVIKTALKQQKHLIDEYGYNHMVSINISGKDIAREHFFLDVISIIEASEIPADKIIFELTESASFSSNKQTIELIEKLRDIGITISIDDFGTGYSSMSQINTLSFQELKVDRQFVENIDADPKRKVITKATVEMAKGLGLEVVAEGINSKEDENILRGFGCDIGQGYYYAKPMAFNDYIDWLNRLDHGRIVDGLTGEFIPAETTVPNNEKR